VFMYREQRGGCGELYRADRGDVTKDDMRL
jgi:hypothetical protein